MLSSKAHSGAERLLRPLYPLARSAVRSLVTAAASCDPPAGRHGRRARPRRLALITQLTSSERRYAAMILLVVAMAGIAMAALGKSDPLGIHGVIVLLY